MRRPPLQPLVTCCLLFACVEASDHEQLRDLEAQSDDDDDDDDDDELLASAELVSLDDQAKLAVYEALAAEHGARFEATHPRAVAASRLAEASAGLHLRTHGERVVQAFGSPIAGVVLDDPRDPLEAEAAARVLLREHADLFELAPEQLRGEALELARVRAAGPLRLDFRQRHAGLLVIDGDFALGFDDRGRLTRLVGAPWGIASMPSETRPSLAPEQVAELAIELAGRRFTGADERATEAEPELVIRAADRRLVWQVRLRPLAPMGIDASLLIDAHDGELLELDDQVEHGTQYLNVRHYTHAGGEDDSPALSTGSINTDIYAQFYLPGVGSFCRFGLQRLGQGRARLWNAKQTPASGTPSFAQVLSPSYYLCGTTPAIFEYSNDPVTDPDWTFNAQTTYWFAQHLKTNIDNWGRYPNSYGHYPIDNASRRVNVEIVVNAHGDSEGYWCAGNVKASGDPALGAVMHGCFRSSTSTGWFDNHPLGSSSTAPTVFFYNHSNNANSPQYHGPEVSPDYGIIVHEVGHYVSWTYGGWKGAGSKMASSLNEGMSMVLPGLYAKQRWGASVGYGEAEDVQTGGRFGGVQWSQHDAGTAPERYSDLSCTIDPYKRAWPFVQAMWHLAQNRNEAGVGIWTNDSHAVENTADLIMWAMYNDTNNSSMTWDMLVWDLIYYQIDRYDAGTEKSGQPSYGSMWSALGVYIEHGLTSACI
ncbi:MAG: hypothetical protein R6X02_32550 [Enhygromyxa sp.]